MGFAFSSLSETFCTSKIDLKHFVIKSRFDAFDGSLENIVPNFNRFGQSCAGRAITSSSKTDPGE
jgi:hypothetical protein